MTQVMKGIRVLEVAQFTFVPAAGADVIKIEHPVRGDTQRGFINSFGNTAAFASNTFHHWRGRLRTYSGQWAPVQSFLDLVTDEQALANDMIFEVEASDGGAPIKLVRNPVQFNHEPVSPTRAPQASEHTELFLMEMGLEWDRIEALKSAGVVA